MGQFEIGFSNFATTTGLKTTMKVIGASGKRFEVIECSHYGSGVVAPADIGHQVQLAFLSNATAGTPGASPTPEKMDQAGAASGLTAGTAYTAEPTTYNTNSFPIESFNQRGGMRWAVPLGTGFKTDGGQTALSIGARVISSSAGNVDGTLIWIEP
jgi:hypothetical protein